MTEWQDIATAPRDGAKRAIAYTLAATFSACVWVILAAVVITLL